MRRSRGSISKVNCFCYPKIDIVHYCIQNVKDGNEFRVCKIGKESVANFRQFLSVKAKKM